MYLSAYQRGTLLYIKCIQPNQIRIYSSIKEYIPIKIMHLNDTSQILTYFDLILHFLSYFHIRFLINNDHNDNDDYNFNETYKIKDSLMYN